MGFAVSKILLPHQARCDLGRHSGDSWSELGTFCCKTLCCRLLLLLSGSLRGSQELGAQASGSASGGGGAVDILGMETTIMGYIGIIGYVLGVFRENGKENANYHLGKILMYWGLCWLFHGNYC